MTSLRHTSGPVLAIASWLGLMLAAPVNGQERPTIFVPFEGFEAFGHILYSHELQPLAAIEKLAEVPPGETLVIVFGDPRVLDTINDKVGGWKKFQDLGGSILIACDYREPTRLQPWKLAVSGTKVVQHQPDSYQGRWEECPLIKQGEQDGHPLFKDWRRGLATNRPSYLQEDLIRRFPRERRPLSRLAVFPPSCWEAPPLGGLWVIQRIDLIYGSPSQAPPGEHMLIIANQGVFMNGMMVQEDNDNFQFAWNAVGWLARARGNRKYALLVDEGKVVSKFGLPLTRPGPLPIPAVQVLNQMLRGLELENRFNRLLLDNIGREPILRVLLLGGTVVLLVLAARRIMHARYRPDTGVPLVVGRHETSRQEPAFAQRQEALLGQSNLWEPALVLARQFFLDHAAIGVPLWDEPKPPPALTAAGTWWQRRTMTAHVQHLWKVAQSSPGEGVSQKEFRRLVASIDELTAAFQAGRARFEKID